MDVLLDRRKYTEYSGKRRGRLAILWQMIWYEFKYSMKQKSVVAFGAFAILSSAFVVIILTATGVLGLVTTKQMAFVANMNPSFLTKPTMGGLVDNTNAIFVNYFWKNSFFTFILTLLVATAGARLISQDIQDKVLSLYLTRPIKRRDYILGKLGILVLIILAVTYLPALVSFIYLLLMSDQVSLQFVINHLWVVWTLLIQSLIFAVSMGSLSLLFSSLTPKKMFAGGGFLVLHLGSIVVAGIAEGLDLWDNAQYLSIPYSIQQLCAWFMQTGDLDLGIAPVYIGLLTIVSFVLVNMKLSKAQVEG